MDEMKHGEKMMDKPHMHEGPMHGPKPMLWHNNWKSPVALGIFIATSMFGLVMLMYAINLGGAAVEAMRPASSQAMSQAEMQQMMQQQAPATSGASATGAMNQ